MWGVRIGFAHQYHPLDPDVILTVLDDYWHQLGPLLDPGDPTDVETVSAVIQIAGGNCRLSIVAVVLLIAGVVPVSWAGVRPKTSAEQRGVNLKAHTDTAAAGRFAMGTRVRYIVVVRVLLWIGIVVAAAVQRGYFQGPADTCAQIHQPQLSPSWPGR